MGNEVNVNLAPIELFEGGGEMGKLVRSMDWSKTPLGPIEQWPQSLKTTVSLCLGSNFPISIAWGPESVQIYNDGYWPICGDKHPTSMGQDYKECWASAWPVIGKAFEDASKGQPRFLTNQRIFLERFGYMEETFFTFSFSPIIDESGGVGGLFHPVTELTQQSLGERRLELLRKVAALTVNVKTTNEAITKLMEMLTSEALDVPFSLLYSLSADGTQATLAGSHGFTATSSINAEIIPIKKINSNEWPLGKVLDAKTPVHLVNLAAEFGIFECAPYPEAPRSALIFPVELPGLQQPFGFFITGVSARRELDEPYRTFYDLLIAAITNLLIKAKTNEDEEQRLETLLELDRAKTAFFSNISHEFRTPLMLMLGPVEDLINDTQNPLNAAQKESALMMQRNAFRLQRLVNNLLDFSKLEAGRLEAKYHATEIAAFTGELASTFRSSINKAGLEFNLLCKPLSQPVYVDREMWEKIIFNLLSNALKFTFSGSISVTVSEDKHDAIITITDTGEGVSKEGVSKLFQRFSRIEGVKSRTHEGSGIGLAFISELIKMHGGEISIQSELKKGSTFKVKIPFGSGHLPAEKVIKKEVHQKTSAIAQVFLNETTEWTKQNNATEEPVTANATTEDKLLILVVDDNADVLGYITRILKQSPEWEIAEASNGLEALAFVDKKIPDLILSDIMMPEMDGFELLKRIRENKKTKKIPLILLSARAGEEATIQGLEHGADDYLVKPFSAKELYARVKTQLYMSLIRADNMELVNDVLNRSREMEQMTYIASHDLQQPLNNIVVFLQLLETTNDNNVLGEKMQKYLHYAIASSTSIRNMIHSLLDYSRLGKKAELELTDFNEILESVKSDLNALIEEKNAVIEVAEMPVLMAYADKVKMLFQNFINNAIKFQRPNIVPKIMVSAIQKDKYWEFAIRDNGIGIEEKYYEKIFQIFQRLHTQEAYEGTGIGLAHCKKIIELHRGSVWVESTVGQGTTIYFSIKKQLR